ncbi:MAG: 7-cyano-7-deazaguanine synthase QueC [Akkermansiaceae bacterium]|nr:7-cyano-7-deazaguanine synthase QueC [Akkermansiaceae bacterium]
MKVAVLLSGGLDSTTALHWARRHHEVVCALAFDYGSNHAAQELACARKQAELCGVPYCQIDIRSISAHLQSALLSGADAIPTADYAEDNLKQTVVPFRNGIFLSIAAGIAESKGATGLVIAAHSGDHALYPDCREDFMAAMSAAISHGTYAQLQILRPFISLSKTEIAALGKELGVDFAHTYSCYCGGTHHCGHCATCRERKDAFRSANIPDPTVYEQ